VALVIIVGMGPRAQVASPTVPEIDASRPDDLRAWHEWLATRERNAGVADTANAARVVFANGDTMPARTAWSVVYLHGFSATRKETAPLAELVAQQLGANLFEARLRGHGLPGDSMGVVSAADWLQDAQFALDVGRQLGDSVLVIGTSTGGTLGVWLATLAREQRAGIAALVLVSPNFGPKDKTAAVLTWPWAQQLLPRFMPYREWTPRNEEQARHWTIRYPSTALFPMQALVEHVRERALDGYDTPTLVFYHPNDEVVDAERITNWLDAVAARTSAPLQQIRINPLANEDGHVLAGRIVSPSQTLPMRDSIVAFVRGMNSGR
jgi:esterase/lipase